MAQQKNEVQSLLEKAMFQQLLQILDWPAWSWE